MYCSGTALCDEWELAKNMMSMIGQGWVYTLDLGLNFICLYKYIHILLNFLLTVKVAPHECVIKTGLP